MQALAIMALGVKEKVASRCDILSFYRGKGKIQHRSRVAEVSATSPLVSTKREAIAVISSSAFDLVASDNASDLVLRAMRHTGHNIRLSRYAKGGVAICCIGRTPHVYLKDRRPMRTAL
jgi:hypothetical protein